jgi:hypothetical protein
MQPADVLIFTLELAANFIVGGIQLGENTTEIDGDINS